MFSDRKQTHACAHLQERRETYVETAAGVNHLRFGKAQRFLIWSLEMHNGSDETYLFSFRFYLLIHLNDQPRPGS